MKEPPELLARVELELIDSSRDARRFYAMTVAIDEQLPLFPELAPALEALVLVVAHGRLGRRPSVRRLRFTDLHELRRTWRSLLSTRFRHGYRTTFEG